MTPTRYPTWRSLAFAIAILMFLSLVVLFSRTDLRPWNHSPGDPPASLRLSVFSQAITLFGAWTMRRRPARGFILFGAGFLVMVAAMLVLLPWELPLFIPVAALLAPGLGYTWLGWKQRSADRVSS